MQQNILSILSLVTLLFATSCADTRLDNVTSPVIYLPQSGEVTQTVYKTGEPFVFRLGVYKAGYDEVSASASVHVMSMAELDAYNSKHNTSYKRLPDNCFQLKNESLNFSQKSRLEYADIHIDYKAIEALSDFDSDNSPQYVVPVELTQASLELNKDKLVSLIKPLVREPLIYFDATKSKVVIEASTERQYKQELVFAVDFLNVWDISVDLYVDPELVAAYNTTNGVSYSLLPANTYTITPNPVMIANKIQKAKCTISFDAKKMDYDDFILPVTIRKTSKFTADTLRNVHFVHVSKPAKRFNRTNWTILGVSSEEAGGEGEGNGLGKCVLDGDLSTYWHSQWSGEAKELPHYITIDMQESLLVTVVDLQRRPNQKDTKSGHFYISSDNVSFTKIGSFEMADSNDAQSFKVTSARGRYLKVEITESRRSPFANMSEIYVRGVK